MALILTFLGKGGCGCTTVAIAAAKKLASNGKKVLLVGSDPSPAFGLLLKTSPTNQPALIESNLFVVQLQSTVLLEQAFEEIKGLEKDYLRSPILKNIYGQELGILPGMDSALALQAIRDYDKSGKYDVIIYDGISNMTSLRMFGVPEILSWYVRRFSKVWNESDLVQGLSPFIQPITSTILNIPLGENPIDKPTKQANNILDEGKAALADPNRIAAYLVSSDDPVAISTAKYLWGGAQQIGLIVGGVILNQGVITESITNDFSPLSVTELPTSQDNWQPLIDALPDFSFAKNAPKPITIDTLNRTVKVYLPGLDKKQVKLTQSGPEITVEAGDQRRNILLPPGLSGQQVKGAKFSEGYLIISL